MGSSDGSAGEVKSQKTEGSAKSAGEKIRTRKKKSRRRRPSNGDVSEASNDLDCSENGEVGSTMEKQKSRRKKRSQAKKNGGVGEGGGTAIKDSMLISIKNKRKENANDSNNTDNQKEMIRRRVSLSSSTILRENKNKKKKPTAISDLDVAMGKIPRPDSFESGGGASEASADTETSDDEEPGKEELGQELRSVDGSINSNSRSALKPSKYGSSRKKASFAMDGVVWRPIGYGADEDHEKEEPPHIARRIRPNPIDRKGSWKPEGLPVRSQSDQEKAPVQFRRSSSGIPGDGNPPRRTHQRAPDDNNHIHQSFEDSLKSSLVMRPGIKRRNSMSSHGRGLGRKLSTTLATPGDPNHDKSQYSPFPTKEKPNVLDSLKSTVNVNQHAQMRRFEMSEEQQTYIPPKTRDSSILTAFGHVIRGSLIDLTLWTYSAGFLKVMIFFLIFYIVNIFMWAAVMDGVDYSSGGRCIHEDAALLTRSERYEFVFELSWATFTTVGYGTISPKGDVAGCYPIRFTCAFVAFVGVLFASTTAAIMYSKLMRLLAKAHVTFSSTLCVQFGKGNEGSTVRFGQLNFRASVAPASMMKQFSASDLMDDDDDKKDSPGGSEDGFPVIEFRMINDRANNEGSEIWDAQIRGIVQLHKEQSSENNHNHSAKDKSTDGESTLDLEKKVYYPVALSPDSHPHFSRIWYARHVLNAESPLLKREMRDMIVKDGGKWDKSTLK
mmetsp:Transcript_12058/g.22954  ORF Transcript_12058/g.22954 Transcript_12058/m.22954 type:complete len:722 (+) Transcript_12058:1342-3507(+)